MAVPGKNRFFSGLIKDFQQMECLMNNQSGFYRSKFLLLNQFFKKGQ